MGGLFVKSAHKEIKSTAQAENKKNVYTIKKDGRDVLVEYTKLETNHIWFSARCVNMLEQGRKAGKPEYQELRRVLKNKLKFRGHAELKGATTSKNCRLRRHLYKNFVGRGCGICNWTGDKCRLTDAHRRDSANRVAGSRLAADWNYKPK